MKFAQKLSLTIILLLSLLLCVLGYIVVSENFKTALETETSQNYAQHILERYSLDYELISLEEKVDDEYLGEFGEQLSSYIGASRHWIAIVRDNGGEIYSNVPLHMKSQIDFLQVLETEKGYFIRDISGIQAMIASSEIVNGDENIWLISVYDISNVFEERSRQTKTIFKIYAVGLLVAAIIIITICYGVTRPIRRLTMTSRKIAGGSYSSRSNINSKDEVGELARNFNKMAEAVENRITELNLSIRQREDFVAAFTHEIKTPMTAIIGHADRLRFKSVDREKMQMSAGYIYREAKRLEVLSQKLLALMGLDAEGVHLLACDANKLLVNAARSLETNFVESGIPLTVKREDNCTVEADADLICDLLRNLLLNAIKAEPKNGIEIGTAKNGDVCRFYVKDTGRGIAKEELGRITEAFYMVDKSRARKAGGSGVGLALCSKIADIHGSKLVFDSEVGKGTVVYFDLRML